MGKLDGVDLHSLPKGKHGDGNGLWLVKMSGTNGSWMLRVSVARKLRHFGLGSVDVVSLTDARDASVKYRKALQANKLFGITGGREDESKFFDLMDDALTKKEKGDDF